MQEKSVYKCLSFQIGFESILSTMQVRRCTRATQKRDISIRSENHSCPQFSSEPLGIDALSCSYTIFTPVHNCNKPTSMWRKALNNRRAVSMLRRDPPFIASTRRFVQEREVRLCAYFPATASVWLHPHNAGSASFPGSGRVSVPLNVLTEAQEWSPFSQPASRCSPK